jgi:hypothetical protein
LRKGIRFGEQFFDVGARGQPSHAKKKGENQKHPGFEFHAENLSGRLYGSLSRIVEFSELVSGFDIAFQARNFAALAQHIGEHGKHTNDRTRRKKYQQCNDQ